MTNITKAKVVIMYLFFLLPLSAWGQELVRTVHIPKTEVPFDILTKYNKKIVLKMETKRFYFEAVCMNGEPDEVIVTTKCNH